MSAIDEFVAQCSIAVKEDRGPAAVKEVVERAVGDRHLLNELPLEADVKILHSAEDLTILHVVMAERPAGAGRPIPHNHLMWALIGVTHGSEENEFFRSSGRTIEPSGRGRGTLGLARPGFHSCVSVMCPRTPDRWDAPSVSDVGHLAESAGL